MNSELKSVSIVLCLLGSSKDYYIDTDLVEEWANGLSFFMKRVVLGSFFSNPNKVLDA